MRRAANRDKGEGAIVEALRAVGASVEYLDLTDGPDILVGWRELNFLFEVKEPIGPNGGASKDGQHLSEGQAKWHATWNGQVAVVRTPLEALIAIGACPP